MKKLYCLFLFIVSVNYSSIAQYQKDSAWIVENYTKQEVMVEMRDGIKLFTAIYAPKDQSEKHPIMFMRTPYSCNPYGETNFPARWNKTGWKRYFKENYIVVMQDVRGRYMSEGVFEDVRPFIKNKKKKTDIDEASDTYDSIDWLIKNTKQNNGNVGMMGISYPGFYASMGAVCNHPNLKAVSPQAPVTDWFIGDDFHHNGAFFLMDGFSFYSGFGKPRPKPTTQGEPGYPVPGDDAYDFYLKTGALKNFTKLMGKDIVFWNDMMKHPNYDAWWKSRDARKSFYDVRPAVLFVGGLFDAEDCWGAWNSYKALEKQSPSTNNKIVMGPWFHGSWDERVDGSQLGNVQFGSATSTWYQDNVQLPFFNYHLKGIGDKDPVEEATIFFTGENKWKTFSEWPPKKIKSQNYFLSEENKITTVVNPKVKQKFSSYSSDPAHPVPHREDVGDDRTIEYMCDDQRFASRRPDVLTFRSAPMENSLTLAGPIEVDLDVSISTTDADFIVKLIDQFPLDFSYHNDNTNYPMKGYELMVRGEVMRGKFRNSFEKPEAFKPGQNTKVKFTLPDVSHTFQKGHRLVIQIQSTWFPLVDRNPQQFTDIYHCKDEDFIKSEIKIHHDGQNHQSKVILPVLE